jgi:hypothetical protein
LQSFFVVFDAHLAQITGAFFRRATDIQQMTFTEMLVVV